MRGKRGLTMKITKEIGFTPEDTTITRYDPVFFRINREPFRYYGLREDFTRVPEDVAKATSPAVERMARYTVGGRVRFATDSDYVVLHADVGVHELPFTTTVVTCWSFDLLKRVNGEWQLAGSFCPSQGEGKDYIESRIFVGEGRKELMISFPLFSAIPDFAIALREGSNVWAPEEYTYPTPVVFYGSSIVHGSCAGRPSTCYPAIVSQLLDTDFISLGFSGAALCEPAIIDYIGTLTMSVFVYDYDHNAPNAEYLEKTHYAGYERFRRAQPDTPVIMASKPDYYCGDVAENERRRQIVRASYERAVAAGDKNVSYIDGYTFYPDECRHFASADGCHPNDFGYYLMGKRFAEEIKKYLK